MRVLWLFGPPGVGKSTTAWEVLNALSDGGTATAYVDIDQLAMVYPAPDDDPYAELLAGRALAAVAGEFERRGAEWLVVSGVLSPELMPLYLDLMAPFGLSMIRLTVDLAELRARMDARGVDEEGWTEVLEDVQAYDASSPEAPVVVAAGMSPAEVARRVIAIATTTPPAGGSSSGLERERMPTAPIDRASDAVLLGGTTGVGKSSVAWSAFMALRDRGMRTAFVDLRQIGFFGRDGGPVDHEVQAAVLAVLWPVHRAAGAELLLLNGPVDRADQVVTYERALPDTPLRWHRLVASQAALAARIQGRRAVGSTARLAGDYWGDLDPVSAQRLARESYQAQRRADALPGSRALDTTHLSVEGAAEMLLRHVGE